MLPDEWDQTWDVKKMAVSVKEGLRLLASRSEHTDDASTPPEAVVRQRLAVSRKGGLVRRKLRLWMAACSERALASLQAAAKTPERFDRRYRYVSGELMQDAYEQLDRFARAVRELWLLGDRGSSADQIEQARVVLDERLLPESSQVVYWSCFRDAVQGSLFVAEHDTLSQSGALPPRFDECQVRAKHLRCLLGNPFAPISPSRRCGRCGMLLLPTLPILQAKEANLAFWARISHQHGCGCKEGPLYRHPWRTDRVVGMARRIHEEDDWDALPVLADMAEEDGCEDPVLLTHLRSEVQENKVPGTYPGQNPRVYYNTHTNPGGRFAVPGLARPLHTRGCWALDLIQGRE